MLQVESFTFNAFQENTYLIVNEKKECWIVDPGMYDNSETNYFFRHIETHQLRPLAIINTHTHLDHIFGVQACKKQYDIPFLIHEKDLPVLQGAKGSAMLFGFEFNDIPQPDAFLKENNTFLLGDDTIHIRLTPGHSPGSVVFYSADYEWVIGGDVIFNGSIGRTDLPGGNYSTLIESIKTQVFTMPEVTRIFPGHGPVTTIRNEKKSNPFLQDI